jgi:hypothetical protein
MEPTDERVYDSLPGESGSYGIELWGMVATGTATLEVEEWI